MLHHADARRHEQQRQMLEETVGGIAERDRQRRTRQHQDEQQDHADHRSWEGEIDGAHRRFSDKLADEQGGDRGQHAGTSLGTYAERGCSYPCFFASRNPVALQQVHITVRSA